MRVWVQGTTYEPNDGPIIILLSDQDKRNIAHMAADAHAYMAYPADKMTAQEALDLVRKVAAPFLVAGPTPGPKEAAGEQGEAKQ